MKSVVPPDTFWVADWITWPYSTSFSRMVPAMGAVMVTSLRRSWASALLVSARTNEASALAVSSSRDSNSCLVITAAAKSSSLRFNCSSASSLRTLATS